MQKRLIFPERVRRVPKQFSWVDQRLVREGYIQRCDVSALALYLFLVTVGDAQGLSYYSDESISQRLSVDEQVVSKARQRLINAGLIAYAKPLYQVLSLEEAVQRTTPARSAPQSMAKVFEKMLKQAQQ